MISSPIFCFLFTYFTRFFPYLKCALFCPLSKNEPSSLGNDNRFKGFVFMTNVISWRLLLYPTPKQDNLTWAGKLDDITANLDNAAIQILLSNPNTQTLGPVILTSDIHPCN
jgi:hypothetical protein